jgi:hypothetical protein
MSAEVRGSCGTGRHPVRFTFATAPLALKGIDSIVNTGAT